MLTCNWCDTILDNETSFEIKGLHFCSNDCQVKKFQHHKILDSYGKSFKSDSNIKVFDELDKHLENIERSRRIIKID